MNRFAFVVASSENYREGMKALVASMKKHNPNADIVLALYKWDLDVPGAKIIRTDDCNECQVQGTAIERFRIAFETAKDYEAICMLDADMFLLHDCSIWFELAAKGFIVTGHNGMLINFNKAYHEQYELPYNGDIIYEKLHTSVPIFISEKDTDWFDRLYSSKRHDYWDDFLYLNLIGKVMGKDKNMVCLPPYYFTGIHHFQMKPECGVFEKGGYVLSGTEEIVYMVHGKWWWEGWLQDLQPAMDKFSDDENIGPRGKLKIKQSIELLKREFWKYNKLYDGDIVLNFKEAAPELEGDDNLSNRVNALEKKIDTLISALRGGV